MTTSELTSSKVLEPQSAAHAREVARLSLASRSQLQLEMQHLFHHRLAMIGLAGILLIVAAALLVPYPFDAPHLDAIRAAPSRQFLFGIDSLGRDLLSRVLYGARIALLVCVAVVAIEVVVGVCFGMLAGYFRGYMDLTINMLSDRVWAFPPLVLVLGVVAAMGPGLVKAAIVLALTSWAPFMRVTRAKVMSLRQRDFSPSQFGRRQRSWPHSLAAYFVQHHRHPSGLAYVDPARRAFDHLNAPLSRLWRAAAGRRLRCDAQ